MSAAGRLAAAGLLFLALFALVFSVGSALGAWPAAAPAAWSRLDVPVGLLFGSVLLAALIRAARA